MEWLIALGCIAVCIAIPFLENLAARKGWIKPETLMEVHAHRAYLVSGKRADKNEWHELRRNNNERN